MAWKKETIERGYIHFERGIWGIVVFQDQVKAVKTPKSLECPPIHFPMAWGGFSKCLLSQNCENSVLSTSFYKFYSLID